jgi:large subunit ribosomal protein L22
MEVTASLNRYRQSPRKVRLVASAIAGKKVDDAMNILRVTVKRSAAPIEKLLASALSNAKSRNIEPSSLFVKTITVDEGPTMKRMMPRAFGVGKRINKRTSHVTLVLASKEVAAPKAKKAKNTAK